jgi:hypothetical protein
VEEENMLGSSVTGSLLVLQYIKQVWIKIYETNLQSLLIPLVALGTKVSWLQQPICIEFKLGTTLNE